MSKKSVEETLFDKSSVKVQGSPSMQPVTNITLAELSSSDENIGTRHFDTEQNPTPAQASLNEQGGQPPYKDCLPCKLTGAAAFSGIGFYALNEARKMQRLPMRQGTAVGMGVTGVCKYPIQIWTKCIVY